MMNKEDLLKIINHYGVMPQLKYFQSEVFELNEAIIQAEEFKLYYGITSEEITNIFWNKVARTLQRIESGYYD